MIDYEEDFMPSLLTSMEGSVLPKAALWALPSMVLAVLLLYIDEFFPGSREDLGMFEARSSQIWSALTTVAVLMLSFRTKQAFSRFWEGTGLLHQMRGEWFDTVSNCVTFSITARPSMPEEVNTFRHTIIRIMSLCHGSALEEISGNNIMLESIDTFGLDDGTLTHLQECHNEYGFNKVEVMVHLLQSLITCAHHEGVLDVPAPVLSRVYQTISRGFVNLLNAKKIQDTKFPFPYAQLIALLLFILSLTTPCMMSVLVPGKIQCAVFTFMPTFGLFCLNFAAVELEDPFGIDGNDLPLEHFQTEMNNCLMMLLHPNTDMVATISDRCEFDFHTLRQQVCLNSADHDEQANEPVQRHKTRRLSEFDVEDPTISSSPERPSGNLSGGAVEEDLEAPNEVQAGDEEDMDRQVSDNFSAHSPDRDIMDSHTSANRSRGGAGREGGQMLSFRSASGNLDNRADEEPPPSPFGSECNVSVDIDNMEFHVGKEPRSAMRQVARSQEPLPMVDEQQKLGVLHSGRQNPSGSGRMEPGGRQRKHNISTNGGNSNSSFVDMADLQPVLAANTEVLIRSLNAWSENINREVDSLQSNSVILQNALQRFSDEMPSIRGHSENGRRF